MIRQKPAGMTTAKSFTGVVGAGALGFALLSAIAASAQSVLQTPAQIEATQKQEMANAKLWNANPAPTDPRDFQGLWWTRRYDNAFRPVTAAGIARDEAVQLLPLTPLEVASRKRRMEMSKAGMPTGDSSADCLPHGMPRIMASPYPFRFDYAPGLIVMLDEVTHDIRFIHMDGQPAPNDEPLTYMGYSRGRWDGNTLVVETDHLNDLTPIDEESLSHGTKLKVHEELTKFTNIYGGVELRDLITIDDPEHFTRPWTTERTYPWRGNEKITEYTCEENNRNRSLNGVTVAK